MKRTAIVFAFAATAVLGSAAFAHDKNDQAVDYRMGVMQVMGWNVGAMGAMVKGKTPFDAADFEKRAARVGFMSDQLLEGFPKGSDKANHTDAKPAIWANFDDFTAKANDFAKEAEQLADTAKAHDQAKDVEQFKKVAAACKACHEKYKAD